MEEKLNEKYIMFKSNKTITLEEEEEIVDLVKQVLKRNDENRKVFLITNFFDEEEVV